MPLSLNRLNQNQREAVLYGNGPLLVLAGAGSGKTSTMTYRIAHLIAERNVPASAILGLSFTNKAATELKERVIRLVSEAAGFGATRNIMISTFHSLCVRILRAHGAKLGFQRDFTILDQSDQQDTLKQIMRNIKIDDRKFDLNSILFEIGQAKSRFLSPDAAQGFFLDSGRLGPDYAIAAASSYIHYQSQLKAQNAMDFDDLLFNAVALLEKHEEVREHYNQRFRYILVDEYQDTNPAQFRLLRLLTQRQQNLCVVGDDDQSIYAWRGADPTHILEFAQHFRGAKTITLDQNYRSTMTILEAANAVIQNNRKRHPKSLWSDRGSGEPVSEVILEEDREEGKFVAEEIFRLAKEKNIRWADFAVLYRSNAQSRIFEESLRMLRVPYKIVGGFSFLDRKEVKNILAYWRLVVNPGDDASLRRVINWPARGIGRTSLEHLGNAAFTKEVPIFEMLPETAQLAPRAAAGTKAFRELILDLRESLQKIPCSSAEVAISAVVSWARNSLEKIQARKALDEETDDPAAALRQWENIEELVHGLGQIRPEEITGDSEEGPADGLAILREYLARMTLEAQDEEEDDSKENELRDEVTLLTLHGAKGLEYPIVFMVGAEDGFLPHRRTIEEASDLGEERRLCYVGITRAKNHLIITRAKNRIRYGKTVPRTRSRFMDEIPQKLLVVRDESRAPSAVPSTDKAALAAHEVRVRNYLEEIKSKLGAASSGPKR